MRSQKEGNNNAVDISNPRRVLVVDNDSTEAARSSAALRSRFGTTLGIRQVGTIQEALSALAREEADLILFDWHAPPGRQPSGTGRNGASSITGHDRLPPPALDALTALHRAATDAAIMVYSQGISEDHAIAALRTGAVECLDKQEGRALGRHVTVAMERHRQRQRLETARREAAHRATHDGLTGLATRELFLEQLEQTLALNARHGRLTGVLFVDLDGFKAVNDTRGHQQGDALLCAIADRLRSCVRRSDSVARLGGDEFVLLVPDAEGSDAMEALKNQLGSLLRQPVPMADGPPVTPGASIGCAVAPTDGTTPAALLAAADRAMYRAKYGTGHRRRRTGPSGEKWSVSGSNR